MKKITLFSNLWRSLVDYREDESRSRLRVVFDSFTCRLRVWHVLCSRMAAVFLLLLPLGVGNAWGQTVTKYSFTNSSWNATCGGSSANWTNNDGGDGYSNNGVQILGSGTGAATSPSSFTNVTKVVVTYNTNKSGGSGTIKIKIGTNSEVSNSAGYSGSSDGRSANFTSTFNFSPAQSGNIKLSAVGSANSIYIVSIEITEAATGPSITTTSSMTTFGCNMTTGVPIIQNFSVSGTNLSANLSVAPPSGYEICLTSGGTYQTSAISLTPTIGTVSSTTIYVRLKDTNAAGSYSGNIACSSGATTKNVAISGSTPFTVTWQANSGTHATTYVAYATGTGTAVGTLPDEPDPADYSCSGKEFYGWYTGSYSNLTTAPTPLVTTSTKVTGDVTFVAVFADEEVGDDEFVEYRLVTSAPSDWSGKYLLSNGSYTATGGYSDNHLSRTSLTPGTTEYASYEFVLTKVGTKYTIKFPGNSAEYLGYKSSTDFKKGNATQATVCSAWKWNPSTSYIANDSVSDRKLGDGGSDIRPYSTSPSGGWVKLYKRIEAPSVTYSDFVTTCTTSKAKTPTFSVSAGTYIGSQSVTISCGTADATIYYTTDNSTPSSSNGSTYSSAITISSTTTLKAIAVKDGLDDSNVASAAYTIRACKEYSLVTNVSTLGMGDKIVILETAGSCALDTTQNASGYRETTTDFALSGSTVRVPDVKPGIQIITLEPYPNASGYWYFNVGSDKYLYATGSSNNYLRTSNKATVTTNANGKWSIALATSVFTVKTNGDATRNKLQYNYNSGTDPRFCCYATDASFANVKVYALQNTSPTVYVSIASLSGFSATYGSASEKQDLIIYGRNLTGNLTVTPPSGYEIKKSGDASYSTSAITITPSTGSVTETVNIRIASGTSVGSPSGNISIAGNGNEVSTNVAVSGTVSKATPVITFTLGKSSALLNEEVGYTLSTTIDGTLTFSYVRNSTSVSSMITNDRTNNKISISEKGTYKIRVNEASPDADKYNAAEQVERELVISARDTFKDLVNGYSDITKDDDGSGTTTPTFAEMEDGATDGCNSTTRALIGWIKASDLETQYGTAGETGYLEDAVGYDGDDIIAPGENIEGTGATWYAVWGEAE